MKFFDKYFRRKKMRSLIVAGSEALYSDHIQFDDFIKRIHFPLQNNLFQIYIAIEVATRITEPLTTHEIDIALAVIDAAESNAAQSSELNHVQYEELAKTHWVNKLDHIKKGKQAMKSNKYSYDGAIYNCEKSKKGTSSSEERTKWRKLCSEVVEAEQNYGTYLAKEAEQKEADDNAASYAKAEAVFKTILAEVEEEKKMYGEKSQEQIEIEKKEIMRGLKESLANSKKSNIS